MVARRKRSLSLRIERSHYLKKHLCGLSLIGEEQRDVDAVIHVLFSDPGLLINQKIGI